MESLYKPVTEKRSVSGENEGYYYVASDMQGWRPRMEDEHVAVLNLSKDEASNKNAFFAVYDGHDTGYSGAVIAKFAKENVHKRLVIEPTYREKQYDIALKKAFLGTDEDIRSHLPDCPPMAGCTAIAALFTSDGKLYVANAGDCRAVLSVNGRAKALSHDHKPGSEMERLRIIAAEGKIEDDRVNGISSFSRAIGDLGFKDITSLPPEQQKITAEPEVITHELTAEDEFFVLASDGIWDCISSQGVITTMRDEILRGKELLDICNELMGSCLSSYRNSGVGRDNMTIVVVAILNGRTQEEWYTWMKSMT